MFWGKVLKYNLVILKLGDSKALKWSYHLFSLISFSFNALTSWES